MTNTDIPYAEASWQLWQPSPAAGAPSAGQPAAGPPPAAPPAAWSASAPWLQ